MLLVLLRPLGRFLAGRVLFSARIEKSEPKVAIAALQRRTKKKPLVRRSGFFA
ncbi:MAG: hypothetical protein JWQ01_2197 [Massilia sp.]|nr:hypothetical protein [Massilia sp.]